MRNGRFHLIVVSRNNAEWIESCLGAIHAQTLEPAQVTVFDNASTDDTAQRVERAFKQVRVIRSPTHLGLSGAANRAAAVVRDAQFVVLVDPEAILAMDALERLAGAFSQRPLTGVIGCKVLDGDVETIHHVGLRLLGNGLPSPIGQGEMDRGQFNGIHDALTIQMGAMAVRSEVWCELGGLDERFWPAFYERIDFCLRSWLANWAVSVAGDATVTHFGVPDGEYFTADEVESFFRSRAVLLMKHYRGRDWLTRYLPDEIRWLLGRGTNGRSYAGKKMLAIRKLIEIAMNREKVERNAKAGMSSERGW